MGGDGLILRSGHGHFYIKHLCNKKKKVNPVQKIMTKCMNAIS